MTQLPLGVNGAWTGPVSRYPAPSMVVELPCLSCPAAVPELRSSDSENWLPTVAGGDWSPPLTCVDVVELSDARFDDGRFG